MFKLFKNLKYFRFLNFLKTNISLFFQMYLFYYLSFFIYFIYFFKIFLKKHFYLKRFFKRKRKEIGYQKRTVAAYESLFIGRVFGKKRKTKSIRYGVLDYIYRFCFKFSLKINLSFLNFGFLFYYYLEDNSFVKFFLKKNILLYRITDFLVFELFTIHLINGIEIWLLMRIKLSLILY
jgi:hypothetical protein